MYRQKEKMEKLLIHFPVRCTSLKLIDALFNYYELLEDCDNVMFNIVIDEDDIELNNKEVIEYLNGFLHLTVNIIKPCGKIGAINSCIPETGWDVLLLASHDMFMLEQGYDQIILDNMKTFYPDTDGVLWFKDTHKPDVCTLAVVGKKYYDSDGFVYNPVYVSMYADNEMGDLVMLRGKCQKLEQAIFEHQHPIWTGKDFDKVKFIKELAWDKTVYQQRKANNFGL